MVPVKLVSCSGLIWWRVTGNHISCFCLSWVADSYLRSLFDLRSRAQCIILPAAVFRCSIYVGLFPILRRIMENARNGLLYQYVWMRGWQSLIHLINLRAVLKPNSSQAYFRVQECWNLCQLFNTVSARQWQKQ